MEANIDKLLGNKYNGYKNKFISWSNTYSFQEICDLFYKLKSHKIDRSIYEFQTIEEVYDYIDKSEVERILNRVSKSLPSKSRRNFNDRVKDLILNHISNHKFVIDFYSKKGGRYKNPDDLYNDTKYLLESFNKTWNESSIPYLEKELVYRDEYTMILKIDSYERSRKLGSKHWCISTRESSWDQYISNGIRTQYFIYDFSKPLKEKESLIGVTVNPSGYIHASHYRDDSEVKDNVIFKVYENYLLPIEKSELIERVNLDSMVDLSSWDLIDELKGMVENGCILEYHEYGKACHMAAKNRSLRCFEYLLDLKAFELRDNVLWHTISIDSTRILTKFLKLFNPDNYSTHCIRFASKSGLLENIKVIENDKRFTNYHLKTVLDSSLLESSENGHLHVVKHLIERGADPTYINCRCVKLSFINDHYDIVEYLLGIDSVKEYMEEVEYNFYSSKLLDLKYST